MKIPTTTSDRYKTGQGLFNSPVPGREALAFTPPPHDNSLLSLRETADVERDLQEWSAFAAQWEEEFTASRKGTDARNAEQAARKMHEEFYETRRTAYAENPRSGRYLREEGSAIASRSIQNMADYTQAEDTRYIEGVLQNEEQNLRHTMASPDASDHERMQAFNSFAMKMSSWRTTRGESPEVTKQWRTAFAMDMGTEYLQARFQRSLDENPDTALATIQAAQSLRNPSAQNPKSPAQNPSIAGKNSRNAATLLTRSEAVPTARTAPGSEVAEPSNIPHSDADRDASGSTRENGIADAPEGAPHTESPAASAQGDTVSQITTAAPDRASGGSSDVSPSMAQITAQEETQGATSANTTGSALPGNLSPEATQKRALIQIHAAEYARFFSPDQLDILHSQAQAHAQQRQLHRAEQRQNIQRDTKKTLGKALRENDFTAFLQAEAALVALGDPNAAQNITSLHKAAKLAQPQLALLEQHPLSQRRALATTLFEHHTLKNIDGGTAAKTLQEWHEEKLRADEASFQRDPAGFVANHPRLAQQGLTHEEFLEQQGISEQEYIERSLAQQLAMGANQGVTPKVLSTQQAADLKDQFADCKTPRKKAEFLQKVAKQKENYADLAMAEAGFSSAIISFAYIAPQLALSDLDLLVQAANVSISSMDIPPVQHDELTKKISQSPLLHALDVAQTNSVISQEKPLRYDIQNTLESFVALGGNLQHLERLTSLTNSLPTKRRWAALQKKAPAHEPFNRWAERVVNVHVQTLGIENIPQQEPLRGEFSVPDTGEMIPSLTEDTAFYAKMIKKYPHKRPLLYNENAIDVVKSARDDIFKASLETGVPAEAIAGAMLDERTSIDEKSPLGFLDHTQNFVAFFAKDYHEAKKYTRDTPPEKRTRSIWTPSSWDIGPYNINIATGFEIFEQYVTSPTAVNNLKTYVLKGFPDDCSIELKWSIYVNRCLLDEKGGAYLAAIMMKDGLKHISPYMQGLNREEQAALMVTYFKQGFHTMKKNYDKRVKATGIGGSMKPGEGAAIFYNMQTIHRILREN